MRHFVLAVIIASGFGVFGFAQTKDDQAWAVGLSNEVWSPEPVDVRNTPFTPRVVN